MRQCNQTETTVAAAVVQREEGGGEEGELKRCCERVGDVVNAVVVTYFRFAELAQEERNYEATKY